ncbi:MAG: flagellar biosynthesis anti-sigma factor FlgM [Gammaproteobacteria bacterium]|jgi:negative regulator of flagellin synthesis FlgM
MKIDPGLKPLTPSPAAEARPAAQGRPDKLADSAAQTAVSLSPQAAQLQQLEAQLAAIPVIDRARVDSIKAAIAAGEYAINTENIADGLVNEVKDMLHAAR